MYRNEQNKFNQRIWTLLIFSYVHILPSCVCLFVLRILLYLEFGVSNLVREQSFEMLPTGVEEFKMFLGKISHPNIKFYFGFKPQRKNEKKVNTTTTKKNFNYRSLQQAKE